MTTSTSSSPIHPKNLDSPDSCNNMTVTYVDDVDVKVPMKHGGVGHAVVIDDPPLEDDNAELEGNEHERYEATKLLVERQGKSLRLACRDGDMAEIMKLIDGKADVNAPNASGTPPLHEAAYARNPDVVKLLLTRGALVDKTDVWGATALHFAASGGCAECCHILLERGANVDHPRHDAKRPFDIVDRTKHSEAFQEMVLRSMALADKRTKKSRTTTAFGLVGLLAVAMLSYLIFLVKGWFL